MVAKREGEHFNPKVVDPIRYSGNVNSARFDYRRPRRHPISLGTLWSESNGVDSAFGFQLLNKTGARRLILDDDDVSTIEVLKLDNTAFESREVELIAIDIQ